MAARAESDAEGVVGSVRCVSGAGAERAPDDDEPDVGAELRCRDDGICGIFSGCDEHGWDWIDECDGGGIAPGAIAHPVSVWVWPDWRQWRGADVLGDREWCSGVCAVTAMVYWARHAKRVNFAKGSNTGPMRRTLGPVEKL